MPMPTEPLFSLLLGQLNQPSNGHYWCFNWQINLINKWICTSRGRKPILNHWRLKRQVVDHHPLLCMCKPMSHLGMTKHRRLPFSITCERCGLFESLVKPSLGSLNAFPNQISVQVWNPVVILVDWSLRMCKYLKGFFANPHNSWMRSPVNR